MPDSTKAGLRVLVCGGRDFIQFERAFAFLDAHHAKTPFGLVIIGLDPRKHEGADWMAYLWAADRGIDTMLFPPNWNGRGKPAGPYRNGEMIRVGQPDLVIGFPTGGPGTANMVAQADDAGVRVVEAGGAPRSRPSAPAPDTEQEV